MESRARHLGETDLDLLEQLFDVAAGVGFFVKDRQLRYVAANQKMARFCGVDRPSDIYGKDLRDFFPPEIVARYEALDLRVLETGQASRNHFDLTISGKGEPVWAMFSRIPIKDRTGETVGVAAVAQSVIYADREHPLYRRVSAVAQHLRANPESPLDLDHLAGVAGVSKSQLQRDFRRLLGKTLTAFQHQVRIERALLLLSRGLAIVDVAYACGYADHSAFTRRFREVTGMSPSSYRARAREQGASLAPA